MTEYRCTRNASYTCDCRGRDDITARQGYYIHAESEEEAMQIMANRYPDETEAGFTVQEWQSFNVTVVEVERDSNGNIIHSDRLFGESLAQRVARETGLELIKE